jgi:hypothetical protein
MLTYLVGNVVGEPVKSLIQSFARCSTSALNVPAPPEIIYIRHQHIAPYESKRTDSDTINYLRGQVVYQPEGFENYAQDIFDN